MSFVSLTGRLLRETPHGEQYSCAIQDCEATAYLAFDLMEFPVGGGVAVATRVDHYECCGCTAHFQNPDRWVAVAEACSRRAYKDADGRLA